MSRQNRSNKACPIAALGLAALRQPLEDQRQVQHQHVETAVNRVRNP